MHSFDKTYTISTIVEAGEKKGRRIHSLCSNAKKFPNYWTPHVGLARVHSGQDNFDKAVKEMQAALTGVPDNANKSNLEGYVKRLQSKDDINR